MIEHFEEIFQVNMQSEAKICIKINTVVIQLLRNGHHLICLVRHLDYLCRSIVLFREYYDGRTLGSVRLKCEDV